MAVVIRQNLTDVLNLTQTLGIELAAEEKHISWVRWVNASINTHFINNKGSLPMYLEGDERTLQDEAEFYELRVDGPFIFQPQKDEYILNVEVNVLVQAHIDDQKLYNMQTAIGPIVKAFTNAICVYKYGDGQFDDQSLLGILRLKTDIDETIDVNQFGIIKEDSRLTQTTVEGHYQMEISNNGSN
jgi:hypothetical protein